MRYDNTQTGPWFLLIHGAAAMFLIFAVQQVIPENWAIFMWLGLFVPTAFFGFCFVHLNVQDLDNRMVVRFGPIRLFGTTIHYEQITGFAADRSSFLDGWGIHLKSGSWIYNIWGYDCVQIQQGEKSTWIGTNDMPGLLALLEERSGIAARNPEEAEAAE